MKTLRKPVVGEILFSLNVGNAARNKEQKLTPVEVVSVGRKYFVCRPIGKSEWADVQYRIEDWSENTEYSVDSFLYENEQEWIDDKEKTELWKNLRNSFGSYSCHLSLDQLRRINFIINEE